MRHALVLLVCLVRGGVARAHGAHISTVVRREEADFREGLAKRPRDATTRAEYARWLLEGDRRQEAEMEQRAAVELRPADAQLRAEFAELLAQRDEAEAERQYLEGLRRCPGSARLRASYARFLVVYRQEEERALAEYEAGSELAEPTEDPEAFAEMLAQYGTLITRAHGRGRSSLARAEQQFVRAAEGSPSAKSEQRYASFLRFDKKDYRAAEQAYQKALALDPDFPSALCGYATLLDKVRGSHDEAELLYQQAEQQGLCLSAYAQFLRRVRKDFVRMAEVVVSEAGATDTKLQTSEWDNARVWHRLNVEGGLGQGLIECGKAGVDAVRVLACVLLYLAHHLGALFR